MKRVKTINKFLAFSLFICLISVLILSSISTAAIPGVKDDSTQSPSSIPGVKDATTATTAKGAPSANPLTGLWNTIKTKFNEATNWADNQLFGEEIPSFFSIKWWEQEQWNNPAWWSSTFCAADTRTNQGYLSGVWDWLMRFIGVRTTGCYEFWIKHGMLALLTAFWAVLFARIYINNFIERDEFGRIKGNVNGLLLFLAGKDMAGESKYKKTTMKDQTKMKGWLIKVAFPIAIVAYLIGVKTDIIQFWGPFNTIILICLALIFILFIVLPQVRKEWGIPILLTALVIWIIIKIAIIKFMLWPLMLTSSYIIGPIATGLWIAWYPIWQAEKEKRRLRQMEATLNTAHIKAEFFGGILNSIFKGYFEGRGKRMSGDRS
jgi:hypothetical protein